ncbi:MAG: RCC1 domain-containing protein [Acidimicrobiales bacterium]
MKAHRFSMRLGVIVAILLLTGLVSKQDGVSAAGVVQVEGGSLHTCAITAGGGLQCWGANSYGQLGDGTTTDSSVPVVVSGLQNGVLDVAAGLWHSCAVVSGGGVKCWGNNSFGQLGDGTTTDSSVPLDVLDAGAPLTNVQQVSAGFRFTCALTAGGGVKCWGSNRYGQLGDSTRSDSPTPVDVAGLTTGVSAIDTGNWHHAGRYQRKVEASGDDRVGRDDPRSRLLDHGERGDEAEVPASRSGGQAAC